MNCLFHFKGFEPDTELKAHANVVLNRLLDRSPYGAKAVALLEKDGDEFRCLLDIYATQGPFIASAKGRSPREAVDGVEQKMTTKMERWMNRRLDSSHLFGREVVAS